MERGPASPLSAYPPSMRGTRWRAPVRPFTATEKALFDRTARRSAERCAEVLGKRLAVRPTAFSMLQCSKHATLACHGTVIAWLLCRFIN